jgi:hypothetical protein
MSDFEDDSEPTRKPEPRAIQQAPDKVNVTETKTEQEFILAVLYNAESFDHRRYLSWLSFQSRPLQALARLYVPTGVYRLRGDGRPCCISGYKTLGDNTAALVCMVFAETEPQLLDPSQLENITVEAKEIVAATGQK